MFHPSIDHIVHFLLTTSHHWTRAFTHGHKLTQILVHAQYQQPTKVPVTAPPQHLPAFAGPQGKCEVECCYDMTQPPNFGYGSGVGNWQLKDIPKGLQDT